MLSNFILAGFLLQSGAAGHAQAIPPSPPIDWVIVIAIPIYQPDGAISAESVTLPAAGAGLVHLFGRRSLCDPAVAGAAEPPDAGYGWRVASQVVSRSEKDIVVSVDWLRLWDQGRKTQTGPAGSVQLTLHPGDRIPLDLIPNTAPRADCRAVGIGLEVRLARTMTPASIAPSALPLGATAGGAKPVDAELWLMHRLPSGADQVVHQVVRIPAAGGRFSFAPTPVATSRGDLNVELRGSIDRYRSPTGAEFMVLSMTRTVTGADLPPQGLSGTTGSVVPLPVPSDILSFETPGAGARSRGVGAAGATLRGGGVGGAIGPAGGGAGGQAGARSGGRGTGPLNQISTLLEGHQFALRVRITPVPGS